MYDLLDQIRSGIDQNLYYLALFTSLAIPDICGAFTTPNAKIKPRYIEWFDKHVAKPKSYQLTGEDCYYFRCSMLHQGTTTHTNSSFNRILFIEPNNNKLISHNNIFIESDEKVLNIDLKIFCNDIIEAARTWFNQIKNDDNFKQNYDKFIRRHKNGLPPYISGVPVIG